MKGRTYARARLWLGITYVGTFVTISVLALVSRLPASVLSAEPIGIAPEIALIAGFFAVFAGLGFPFDWLGGYYLPRRFARSHPPLARFAANWLRGTLIQTIVLSAIAVAMLAAGRRFGTPGVLLVVACSSSSSRES